MRIMKTLGAAFLMVGTVGAVLVFGAYNDNIFSYRADGMIMINDEVFYPVGVYFEPVPDQLESGDPLNPDPGTFWFRLDSEGRDFCFNEFAANGGNFVMFPCLHTEFSREEKPYAFDHYVPCDVTDYHAAVNQCTPDLQAGLATGIKLMSCPNLGYFWGEGEPYKLWGLEGPRSYESRQWYFNTVKGMVEDSEAEEAFFGWYGFQEPAWLTRSNYWDFPTVEYIEEVYTHIREMETNAGANHPIYVEEPTACIIADMLYEFRKYCDIACYSAKASPAPYYYYKDWEPRRYMLGNNPWCNVTGDHADIQFSLVHGLKPVMCCLDGYPKGDQGKRLWDHQIRFVTYDAVIHRVNALVWGMCHYVFPYPGFGNPLTPGDDFEFDIKPTFRQVGLPLAEGGINEVIKAPFDDTLVEVIIRLDEDVVERTAFVGGDLAPKNQFLSGNYILEGCLKLVTEEVGPGIFMDFVYLITANRSPRDSLTHEPFDEYEVTFKPYFSGNWLAAYVLRIESDGTTTQIPVVSGTFTDAFMGEDVHIYKFQKPPRFGES